MKPITPEMIAPCGVDCGACIGYLRAKKPCPGCFSLREEDKTPTRNRCRIKLCAQNKGYGIAEHARCEKFPCRRMRSLDDRYRLKYRASPVDNLRTVKDRGIDAFVGEENTRWTCPSCGGRLSMHRDECPECRTISIAKSDNV